MKYINYVAMHACCVHIHHVQFEDVSLEELPMLLCSLGGSRKKVNVRDLILTNFDIGYETAGPIDR